LRLDDVHRHLLSRRGAVEVRPFDPDLSVFKVGGRMFATTIPSRTPPWLVVKCDPFHSELLRETHAAVRPGYPMNKRHWITVILGGSGPGGRARTHGLKVGEARRDAVSREPSLAQDASGSSVAQGSFRVREDHVRAKGVHAVGGTRDRCRSPSPLLFPRFGGPFAFCEGRR
jgi:predicted DNA-binding protein (MmcQ/YjbR family)